MIAAAAVLLLYRFSFSVPGYEGRHFIEEKAKYSNMVTNSRHFLDVLKESREHYRVLDIKFIGDRTVLQIKSGDLL